jgi:hypothetical protein
MSVDNLIPNDLVLADREFLIREEVETRFAKVLTPEFLKKKKQLGAFEVETARRLSNVRIHVERVIGCVREKYTILQISVLKKRS